MAMLLKTLVFAAAGAVVGLVIGYATSWVPPWSPPAPPRAYPLPYHIPKYPGGVSFRSAMAHDVIHERFARHGDAYYRERNRRVRQQLEELPPAEARDETTDERYFGLLDDLGVGLEALGQRQEAVRLMRDTLREQ